MAGNLELVQALFKNVPDFNPSINLFDHFFFLFYMTLRFYSLTKRPNTYVCNSH